MKPEIWKQVDEAFAEALDMSAEVRSCYVNALPMDVKLEVESLLKAYGSASDFIEHPPVLIGGEEGAEGLVGSRIGPYRLCGLLGAGGMGAVYRAERVDGEFAFDVAIKLVQPGFRNRELLRRLREERQILATMQHPNIARLLDGGDAEGQPFIVMEFIEGQRITDYCRERGVTVAHRLELFCEVCSAVQYAHQRLVVHRDIKPGNILVTDEGVPKLLDFGIAKIMSMEAAGAATLTGCNPFTPYYASPEQIRRQPVTTASDIYSLGALLYELLTYQNPYQPNEVEAELENAVCNQDPPPPSLVLQRSGSPEAVVIHSDLDRIVQKAMRKDPAERYPSAERLSADIRNFLEGRPVEAQASSWVYLTKKFARRHRWGVITAMVAVLFVVISAVLILWQAHVARTERAKAQKRFNEVRRLANSLIFDVHDQIANLPGSTPVRKQIVQKAAEYLDSLGADAGDDNDLLLEISEAYLRLAAVQASWGGANLGDSTGASANYGKAERNLIAVLRRDPNRRKAQQDLAAVYVGLSEVAHNKLDYASAEENARKAVKLLAEMRSRYPQDTLVTNDYARAIYRLAAVLVAENNRQAGDFYRQSLNLYDELLMRSPSDPKFQYSVALLEKTLGAWVLEEEQSPQEALLHFVRALNLDTARSTAQPDNSKAKMDVAFDLSSLGSYYQKIGDLSSARDNLEESLAIRKQLSAADPANMFLKTRIAYMAESLGAIYVKLGDVTKAKRNFELELASIKPVLDRDKADAEDRRYLGGAYVGLAKVETLLAGHERRNRAEHTKQRCEYFLEADKILKAFAQDPETKDIAAEAARGAAECKRNTPDSPKDDAR